MHALAPQEFSSLNAPILFRLLYEAPIEEIISISGMSGGFTCLIYPYPSLHCLEILTNDDLRSRRVTPM